MRFGGSDLSASSVLFGSPGSVSSGGETSTGSTAAAGLATFNMRASTMTAVGTTEVSALSVGWEVVLVVILLLDGNKAFIVGTVLAEELASACTSISAAAS